MSDIDKIIISNINRKCKACGGKLIYLYSGIFECDTCNIHILDDFGKIKTFLEKNGPTPAIIIAEKTGVGLDVINDFLRRGKVEIPENSPYYIKCERCKTDIRYGRYCPECVVQLAGAIKKAFLAEEIGERPKRNAKMHFLDKYNS